jgi:glycine cleavage system H protein
LEAISATIELFEASKTMTAQYCRFTKNHQWVCAEGPVAIVGITDYAQQQLGDVVFVELPKIGAQLKAGEAFGSVESAKAVNEVFAPVSGEVTEINMVLVNSPEIINKDAEGAGWFLKLRMISPSEMDALMDAAAYKNYTAELAGSIPAVARSKRLRRGD